MTNEKIQLAHKTATDAHSLQFRKDGKPYITHPEAVAKIVEEIFFIYPIFMPGENVELLLSEAIQVALLHDTIEDTYITKTWLRDLSFSDDVIRAVVAITKLPDETYFNFTKRISFSGRLAILVKIADLSHNLSDLKEGSQKDKYRFALHMLENILYNIKS